MDQELIINAIEQHVTALQDIFAWALIIALGVGWAGLQNNKELEIVGIKFNRRSAFYVAAFLYVVANIAVLLLLWRIESLLEALDDAHFSQGYATLALHAWLLNPFAYVGTSTVASFSTRWSIGSLIISWWICITSVVVLRGKQSILRSVILPFLFYAVGIASLVSIYQIYQFNLSRLQTIDLTLYSGIKATANGRWVAIWIGFIMGMAMFVVALWHQRRVHRNTGA